METVKFGPIRHYKELSREEAELLLRCTIAEAEGLPFNPPESEIPFTMQILKKRIEAFKLPISFTPWGMAVASLIFGTNPGKVIVVLIDCLNKFEGREEPVSVADLCKDVYPFGFYTDASFGDVVDHHKQRKDKWSNIY